MVRSSVVSAVLLSAGLASSARAQLGTGDGLRPAPPDFTAAVRQRAERQSSTQPAVLTPDAIQGPPTPALIYSIVGMDDPQLVRYVAAYRAHMAATWDTRWGLMSALRAMDRAAQRSDADALRYYQLTAGALWRSLRTQDQDFESSLGSILHPDQLRRFRSWRDAWLRGALLQQRIASQRAIAEGIVDPD